MRPPHMPISQTRAALCKHRREADACCRRSSGGRRKAWLNGGRLDSSDQVQTRIVNDASNMLLLYHALFPRRATAAQSDPAHATGLHCKCAK